MAIVYVLGAVVLFLIILLIKNVSTENKPHEDNKAGSAEPMSKSPETLPKVQGIDVSKDSTHPSNPQSNQTKPSRQTAAGHENAGGSKTISPGTTSIKPPTPSIGGNRNGENRGTTPSPLKITINTTTEYKPEEAKAPLEHRERSQNPLNDERRYLIFTKEAWDKLEFGIGWGRRTPKNHVEQGGVMLGRVRRYKKEIYNYVESIALADTKGSPAFVEFTPAMWADMQDQLSLTNENRGADEQLFIVGWFHTHPNMSVFMSGTDRNTQNLNFWQDWQASLVLNPQGKNYKAFFGKNAIEGKVIKIDSMRGM